MTLLKILQGSGQIGGNIVLIDGKNSKLIFDFGIPLTEADGSEIGVGLCDNGAKKFLPDIPYLNSETKGKETLIFITHAHPDHFGLLRFIDKKIPVYATKITSELIKKGSFLLYKNLFDGLNLKEIDGTTETDDFLIESFSVNHSVAGACAYKITDKVSGKTVLYSGDLRAHGREKLDYFIKKCKNPNYLIIEGTTLNRTDKKQKTEQDVEDEMTEIFKENALCILCCSPFNFDRLVSAYNAAKRAGKIFVLDPYTACILEGYKDFCPFDYSDKNIKIFCHNGKLSEKIFRTDKYWKFGKNKISKEELILNIEKYVVKDSFETFDYLKKKIDLKSANIIYSYWEGYMKKPNFRFKNYIKNLRHIHTSGHISQNDLIDLVKGLKPEKIIPIHTLSNGKFKEFFGEKVQILNKDKGMEL